MNKITQESMIDALSYCALRDLPPEDEGKDVWVSALALVAKADGNLYFAYVEKDPKTGDNRIIKDFGSMSVIRKVETYYPISYLKSEYMPEFKTKTKEERVKYLAKMTFQDASNFEGMSVKELNKMILNKAIGNQLIKEKQKNL